MVSGWERVPLLRDRWLVVGRIPLLRDRWLVVIFFRLFAQPTLHLKIVASKNKLAVPNIDFIVFEDGFELVVDLLAFHAFLEDDLQEAAAACAAYHATVDEFRDGRENLVDERVRAAGIDLLRKFGSGHLRKSI